ncbi:MAG TPA: acyltransferase family protein [Acidimicrobiia bacterium]|nr:acyltransferase family protein [Acidimicrobiia bacterium]
MASSRLSTASRHEARLAYMPALDGVRALAVGAVLLYHGDVSWAQGGYLGVDAFFVLSGFLITSLLVAEWRNEGRIALSAFWARRARRLLPALFLVLALVAVYGAVIAAPVELDQLRRDGLSALGYVANWGQIFSHQSYFESFAAPSPLRHTWSLAIEEQFYLVWPLLVVGVLRRRRRSFRSLTVITGALLAASATWMFVLYQPGADPTRVYYGTDTRAQSLLMGALLALVLARRRRPMGAAATSVLHSGAVVAALALGWIWTHTSEEAGWLYRGGFTLCAVLVAIVIASVTRPMPGLLGALLSFRAVRWVGMVSYGLYLWHWPLYVVINTDRTGLYGTALLFVRLAATFAVATLSFYLVERPIRRGGLRRWRARVSAPAAAGALATALVVTTAGAATHLSEVAASDLGPAPSAPATSSAGTAPVRVMIVGDSVANSMAPGLERAAAAQGLVVWNAAVDGCGITQDVGEQRVWRWEPARPACSPGWRQRWPSQLAQFNPDIVVALLGTDDTFDRRVSGREIGFDSPEGDELTRSEFQEAVSIMASHGAHVAALTAPYSPPTMSGSRVGIPDRSSYNPRWIDRWNGDLRAVATRNASSVTVIDLNRFLDPDGGWTDTVNGVGTRGPDRTHLSPEGADLVAGWLAPQLVRLARAPVPTVNASVGVPPASGPPLRVRR